MAVTLTHCYDLYIANRYRYPGTPQRLTATLHPQGPKGDVANLRLLNCLPNEKQEAAADNRPKQRRRPGSRP